MADENAVSTFTTLESYSNIHQSNGNELAPVHNEIQQLVYQTLTIVENNLQQEQQSDQKNGIEEIKEVVEDGSNDKESQENKSVHLCNICNYQSSSKILLQKHVKIHNTDKPYKCPHCDREFRDSIQLTNHVNIHLGFKPHQCEHCELTFTTRGELVRHTRYKHTLEKPHKCPQCDYASVELSKLKRHLRTHTGERPYLCPHCDYASRDTFKLKRHIRIHTGEKPYVCPICSSRFSQSNSLKSHLIVHGEGKAYTSQIDIDAKKDNNNKNSANMLPDGFETLKPLNPNDLEGLQKQQQDIESQITEWFHCVECNMKFSTKETLDNHKVRHTGERPHQCHICGISFGQQFALRAHLQSHARAGVDIERVKVIIDDETLVMNKLQEIINKVIEIVNPDELSTATTTCSSDSSILSNASSNESDDIKGLLNEIVDNVAQKESPSSAPKVEAEKPKKSSLAGLLGASSSANAAKTKAPANLDFLANSNKSQIPPVPASPVATATVPIKTATLPILPPPLQNQPLIIQKAMNGQFAIQVLPQSLSNCIIINGQTFTTIPQNTANLSFIQNQNPLGRSTENVETKVILKNPPKVFPSPQVAIKPAPVGNKVAQLLAAAVNGEIPAPVEQPKSTEQPKKAIEKLKKADEKPKKVEAKPKEKKQKGKKIKECHPCHLCGKQFYASKNLDRHLKKNHKYDQDIVGQSCGKLDVKHHDNFLSHLNETALTQNYSGISISSNEFNSSVNTSPTKSANTSSVYATIVKDITVQDVNEDNLDLTNFESAQDTGLLNKANETYSSLVKDITVQTKTPKKKPRTIPLKMKEDPKKSLKTLSHLAPSEKNTEDKKKYEDAIKLAGQQKFEIAAALAVGTIPAVDKTTTTPSKSRAIKPKPTSTPTPITPKPTSTPKSRAKAPPVVVEDIESEDENEKPTRKTATPRKRKGPIKPNRDEDDLDIVEETPPSSSERRSKREASKRAKLFSYADVDEDDDFIV